GFLAPLLDSVAIEYWRSIALHIESGSRTVLVAREGDAIVGSGQLAFESKLNGRHRAEVCKVMVLPSHRRRGIAAQVMRELERVARARSLAFFSSTPAKVPVVPATSTNRSATSTPAASLTTRSIPTAVPRRTPSTTNCSTAYP